MEISKLILGTVQFGVPYGINNPNGKPSKDKVNEILRAAYKAGVRLLDTAEVYGNAHEIIGHFHQTYPDNIFGVITKMPTKSIPENIDDKLQQYLDELHIDRLHTLMFHSFAGYDKNKAIIPIIKKLKQQNKVKYLGVSIYNNDEFKKVIRDESIDVIQLPFNVLDNSNFRGELIEQAKELNKIIHTRSVFLQGLFFKDIFDQNPVVMALYDQLKQIRDIAGEYKISVGTLALSYCLSQHNIDNVLIGVDSIDQLTNNLIAQNYKLCDEAINKIDEIKTHNVSFLNPSLWT
ncbi:aldo/keto reductase [Mucilaginibacter sp. McL0603]|uniref:aldo/keto reductase n=1 Tax=Mucilaginibacter sp. McL0603 TaxID=3415670 RepID=UPI003CF083DB